MSPTLRFPRAVPEFLQSNLASKRLLEKLGFHFQRDSCTEPYTAVLSPLEDRQP